MKPILLILFLSLLLPCVLTSSVRIHQHVNHTTMFKDQVLSFIQGEYPAEWLPKVIVTDDYNVVEITHPSNPDFYLLVDIYTDKIAIAVMEEAAREIPFDLGGFHFDFASDQMSEIQTFFTNHRQTGLAE